MNPKTTKTLSIAIKIFIFLIGSVILAALREFKIGIFWVVVLMSFVLWALFYKWENLLAKSQIDINFQKLSCNKVFNWIQHSLLVSKGVIMNKKYTLFLLPTALFILALVAFYLCYPKYSFHCKNGISRENKITGRVDAYDYENYRWFNINNPKKPKPTVQEKWKRIENHEIYRNAAPEKKKLIENKFFDHFVREIPQGEYQKKYNSATTDSMEKNEKDN